MAVPGVNPQNEAGLVPGQIDTTVNVPFGCYADGEASMAVRKELAAGPVNVSLVGYTVSYNTLDNNKLPTSGLFTELRQDFAGVGGDVNFIRTSVEARNYYELVSDVVGVFKVQAGAIAPWGGEQLRMLDQFQMGPNLVRGFAPAGIGPRDLTIGTTNDALGGSFYWGASFEAQTPLYFLPKDVGIKLAAFADAGNLWNYQGPTSWNVTGETLRLVSTVHPLFARRLVWACSGIRRLGRCASIWPIRLQNTARRRWLVSHRCVTARRFSGSAAAPSSSLGGGS